MTVVASGVSIAPMSWKRARREEITPGGGLMMRS